jgi:hypothetical protein
MLNGIIWINLFICGVKIAGKMVDVMTRNVG